MGYNADCAIEKARTTVRKYNSRDPWTLSDRLPNVAVQSFDLGKNVLGYTITDRKFSIINLNSRLETTAAESILTHELGHALLTRDSGANYFYRNAGVAAVGSAEYIANCFMFQVMFGDRGGVNPLNRHRLLYQHQLPEWMSRYFDLIK
ncbi:ImmA/IrrE family metallo-endopeptidase [Lacticaseibacillus hegangensis]|uniref:ImmA/IrrE family metallo-endopeptidase n=1 Tax=Lacticaseibacillus hegangensis TaxID=2486010 RepID=A0ABW4CUY6_9LACO|nr:ImmA/IrrE family metallo-endopeptidase [Lacticaseibacillus hegangensis]